VTRTCALRLAPAALLLSLTAAPARAHEGPPFPIVQDRLLGRYRVSIWTDPDATDDGTAGGSFWVIVQSSTGARPDARTRVTLAARPLDRAGAERHAVALPQPDEPSRYFTKLVLDHEGEWRVEASLDGPWGATTTSADVAATYNLRPPIGALPFMLLPFILVGFLWLKALRTGRRRRAARPG
jgi:hypothetical protein